LYQLRSEISLHFCQTAVSPSQIVQMGCFFRVMQQPHYPHLKINRDSKATLIDPAARLVRHSRFLRELPLRSYPGIASSHQTPGTISTIFTISGIFFLYNFLVRDPGKWCTCAYSAWEKNQMSPPSHTLRHYIHYLHDFRDHFPVQISRKRSRKMLY